VRFLCLFFTAGQLKNLGIGVFKAAGASDHGAEMVSQHLVNANSVGHDSHGVIQIPQHVSMLKEGYKPYRYVPKMVPDVQIEIIKDTATTASHWWL